MNKNANELLLVEPTRRLRIGSAKTRDLKRAQDTIETIAWSTVVAVTTMFLIDGGISQVNDAASLFNSISRLTALLGTDLLLIHMLLIARVPWIDKFYGHDKATLAHKKLGKPVLYFVVAHFAASLIEFSISNRENVLATWWWLTTSIENMLAATVSLLLMIAVVITSLNFARKKMSYEAWFIVHLLSYASVLLAVPHIFTTGSDVAGKPVATIFWVTLYLFVVVNLIWYRVLQPVVRYFRTKTRIVSVVPESKDTVSLYISGKNLAALGGQAGQFYMIRLLTKTKWWRPHPFSISTAPNDQVIRFSIGHRGDFTGQMASVKPGTKVLLEGPYGVFTEERRTKEKVVLIASGIGIPPVRALAESMAARPGDVTVIYRMRDEGDAALLNEVRVICEKRNFDLHVIAGPRGGKNSWLNFDASGKPDQARLVGMVPDVADADIFICGPEKWTHLVAKSAQKAGVPAEQIHSEEYAW